MPEPIKLPHLFHVKYADYVHVEWPLIRCIVSSLWMVVDVEGQ